MPRFFTENLITDEFLLDGENGRHAAKSLRMKQGEEIILCDGKGTDYIGKIKTTNTDSVLVDIVKIIKNEAESPVKVKLYQCLPKSDKFDLIVQKAVELGVNEIIPVISSRCIANFSGKEEKKIARLQKISEEAAKQSGRGVIPQISFPQKFKDVLKNAEGTKIFFYEKGGEHLSKIIQKESDTVSILIGPEGGFSQEEADNAQESGFICASLGKRILRTETAGLCAVSIIMYELEK